MVYHFYRLWNLSGTYGDRWNYLISMNHRLRGAARLSEQASRAKTQFLSAMSHDIRKPDFCGKDTA